MSTLLVSLVTFAVIATISPGGATTLATASGVRFGFRRSIPLLLGIATGLASLVGLVAGGLGSLLVSSPQVQLWLRVAGSLYLLWLAWTIARTGAPETGGGTTSEPLTFCNGILLLWLNPKGWSMAVAVSATYATLTNNPFLLVAILGTVFGLAASISLSLWCLFGSGLSRWLTSPGQWRALNVILGFLLAASIIPMWID